jgi:hypothetical protein
MVKFKPHRILRQRKAEEINSENTLRKLSKPFIKPAPLKTIYQSTSNDKDIYLKRTYFTKVKTLTRKMRLKTTET